MKKDKREIIVSIEGVRIQEIDYYELLEDGSCKLTVTVEPKETVKIDEQYILIEASKLQIDEGILKYSPKSFSERSLKENLEKCIKSGMKDFYCSKFAPSINNEGSLHYASGQKPAIGKTFDWWINSAKSFKPDKNSRLGNRTQYTAFLAVFIGKLVESGYTLEAAWSAVCNDSRNLGNFLTRGSVLEDTGSREICGFCDLGNTCKIVLTDEKNERYCWIAGGAYNVSSFVKPLSNFDFFRIHDKPFDDAVGWVIFDA